jgi:hypothetical protein
MNMANYCYKKGMTLDQYKQMQSNINATASTIYENSKSIHKHDTGIYWPLSDIINISNGLTDTTYFIIDALKKLHMEFIKEDNIIYYRA